MFATREAVEGWGQGPRGCPEEPGVVPETSGDTIPNVHGGSHGKQLAVRDVTGDRESSPGPLRLGALEPQPAEAKRAAETLKIEDSQATKIEWAGRP
jgi:hypothetical protein